LTHYGRKTGKLHEVTIWFVLDRDRLYLGTANVNRQWVRNVQKTPQVKLSIGGENFEGNARFLTDRAEHERAMAAIRRKYWMFRPIMEKFGRPSFAHSQRSGCKHAEAASRDFVELRCGIQKFSAGAADIRASSSPHRRLDGFCDREQTPILRQVECPSLVTLKKTSPVRLARRSVCKHHVLSTRANLAELGVELIDLVFNVEVNFGCGAVLGYLLTVEFHF